MNKASQLVAGIALLCSGLWIAYSHPMWPVAQTTFVLAIFSITVRFPSAWPFLFPVLLVAGDAYPFTGQLVIQEYDSMLLGSLAGWVMRCGNHERKNENREENSEGPNSKDGLCESLPWRRLLWIWGPWILLALSVSLSLIVGWNRLPAAPFGDQLSVYFTNLNSIRIAKGYVWGIVFAVCMLNASLLGYGPEWRNRFGGGVQVAMLYVGCFMLLERWLYESIFDFTREFRASGPFFTMHIGDQHVDAFIALAIPFAFIATTKTKRMPRLAIGTGFVCLMLYAAVATMSRATIVAVGIEAALLSIVFATSRSRWNISFGALRGLLSACAVLLIVVAVSSAILSSEALKKRFESFQSDWKTRIGHWSRSLALPSHGWTDQLLGRGMGTLPRAMAIDMGYAIPPISWRPNHGGEIELKGGWPIYLEQTRWPSRSKGMNLSFDANAAVANSTVQNGQDISTLTFYRCFKSVYHSFEMSDQKVQLTPDGLQPIQVTLPETSVDASLFQRRWRPETFGVSITAPSVAVLRNPLIQTGDSQSLSSDSFIRSDTSAPWCFTCDDHLVWRAKNFLVHLFYEHGMLGLLSFVILVLAWLAPMPNPTAALRFDRTNARVSLVGFLIVACFGTLIDTPWIVALLLAIGAYHQSFSTDRSLQFLEVS